MAGPTSFPSWGSGGTSSAPSTSFPDWSAFDPKPKKKKKKSNDFDWLKAVVSGPSLLAAHLADTAPNKYAAAPFRVYSVLGGAAYEALHHPWQTTTQAEHSITGLPELGAVLGRSWMKEYRKKGGGTKGGLDADRAVLAMLLHSSVADYKKRYGKNYKEEAQKETFSSLMDLLTFAGAGTRAVALGAASKRLTEAGLERTPSTIWQESARPGVLSEGAPRSRKITYQAPGAPKPGEVNLPFSRSPLRRESQLMMDEISRKYPHIPGLGAASRLTRDQGQTIQRTVDRLLGSVPGAESLNKIGDAGRTRLWFGTQIGDHSDEALRQMRDVLHEELTTHKPQEDAQFSDWLWEAKQAGFGPQLLKQLDEAIKYKPDAHYWKAEQAMRDATHLSESVISDQNGFSNIEHDIQRADEHAQELEAAGASPEAIDAAHEFTQALMDEHATKGADLQKMFGSRRNRLREFFDARRYTDNPIRTARLAEMSAHPNIGPEKARELVRITDQLANASGDPVNYWARNVGDTPGEPVQQFMSRLHDAFFQQATGTNVRRVMEDTLGLTGEGERTNVYYSQLQRVLADPKVAARMPAQQFAATLEKAVKPMDWENSGLDLWFEQFKPNEMVGKQQVIDQLSIPLNAYDLEETYLVNDFNLPPEMRTRWSAHGNGSLLSRDPATGEYREIVMHMPGDVQGRGIFTKAHTPETQTWHHWKKDDVAFHIRFHVFEEDGVKKLLVEEIQSDWESEFRKQGLKKHEIPPLEPEAKARLAEIQSRVDDIYAQMDQLFAEGNAAGDDFNQLEREASALEAEEQQHGLLRPSPLGPRYYQAALRRVMREAAEQDVDQVILVDHRVQTARNQFGHPMLDQNGNRTPQDVTAYHDLNPDLPDAETYRRLYGKQHPEFLSKEYKQTPGHSDAAYQGRFSAQDRTGIFSAPGNMPGTVLHMTEEVKAQALQPSALYQKQPNWDAIPQGANELLANGDRLIHLFKDANVSTWIHELSHSALFDLSEADRSIVAAHYAGGAPVEKWTRAAHENFARDFEHYMTVGVAPNQQLQKVFSQISAWMKAIYKGVERENDIPPEVSDVFDRMFARQDDVPDIFIPHRTTKADLGGKRTSQGKPRANREIGDEIKSRVPLFAKNNLALVRSGMVDTDPRHLFEHVNRVVMMARANQLRDLVLQMGKPLSPGEYPDFETQYVVKRAGSGVDTVTHDALENAETPAVVRQTIKDFVDDSIAQNPAEYEKWLANRDPNERLYAVDKKAVDSLFKNVTGSTPGATTGPRTGFGHAFDLLQDSARALLLYGNPGFYIANMVGNSWMSAFADPRSLRYLKWGMQNAVKTATGSDSADPLFGKISVEMGRGPTAGQLSSSQRFLGGGPRGTRIADRYSHMLHSWGQRSGNVIDDSFRVGAWRQVARKHGYKTPKEQGDLIDVAAGERTKLHLTESRARKDLAAIRDEAENLMLDFDSMTPFEKKYLMRSVFLYPFLRASAKYPFMYAGERPVVAGALGTAGTIGSQMADEQFGTREGLPQWAQGYARLGNGQYLNIGSIAPIAPFLGMVESGLSLGQPAEIGINRPLSYLNPIRQLMFELSRSQNKYGRDANALEILQQDAPMPGYLAQLFGLHNPSAQYSDQSELGAILRALRIAPFGMTGQANPSTGGGETTFPEFPAFPEFPNAR